MKKIMIICLAFATVSFASTVSAAEDITAMVGKWKWEGFTIEVKKCTETEVCAKVVAGPKNVGMEMIKSKLKHTGKNFVGKIAHPQTGNTYNTKITMSDANTWHLDGCTDKNVCASGDFKRIK